MVRMVFILTTWLVQRGLCQNVMLAQVHAKTVIPGNECFFPMHFKSVFKIELNDL